MMTLPMTLRSGRESEEPLWRGFQDEEVEEFLRKRLCLQRNILIEWAFQKAQGKEGERCLPQSKFKWSNDRGPYALPSEFVPEMSAVLLLQFSAIMGWFIPVKRLIWNPVQTLIAKESKPCIWDYPPPCVLLFCGKLGLDLFLWDVSTIKISLWDYNEKELSHLKKKKKAVGLKSLLNKVSKLDKTCSLLTQKGPAPPFRGH